MNPVWITGAKGFIGRNLSCHLAAQGNRVVGVGHGHMTENELKANGLQGWLNSAVSVSSLELLYRQYGMPAVVYHLAGGASVANSLRAPLEDFERSVASTAALLEWLRLKSPETAVVYASSAAVYGCGHNGPIAESVAPAPCSPYGSHKHCAETLIRDYAFSFGLPAAILRLFSVYGPGLQKQLLWDVAQRLRASPGQLELGGTGEELRDWIYIDDAVVLLDLAATWADTTVPVVNGGTGCGTTVRATVSELLRGMNVVTELAFSGQIRPGDPPALIADTRRSANFGFSPRIDLRTGMTRTGIWLRETIAV